MKLALALFFGGRSTEHEVSVITALQAYKNLDKDKYQISAVYQSKEGDFYTGSQFLELANYKDIQKLLLSSPKIILGRKNDKVGFYKMGLFPKFQPIDLAFPLFHGSFGEDGCIQGVFETLGLPYTGFNVMGSSVAMDKVISKALFQRLGIPTANYFFTRRVGWNTDPKKRLNDIEKALKFPLFVKPADIGSTIGINKARSRDELSFFIEVAATYSDKILIEEAFEDCIEVNCAALGWGESVKASVCEMPIKSDEALSYEDKYMKGGKGKGGRGSGMVSLSRKIPAPISEKLAKDIQETTVKVFKALEGCGVARIDYFVDVKSEKFWINEVNSPPGSLAFYLYEPLGISYQKLLDKIVSSAFERFEDQKKTQFTFDSPLLSQMAEAGQIKD
ncbi:MAG: D-alanine--D-alanine ligase [Candidatus Levybacteria bacterium]|nr:D-alanine--D-alanine ligase [Candidatus Levybacteria bacterium]